MKKIYIIVLSLILSLRLNAQELNCNVKVTHLKVQGSNVQVFSTLEKSISNFMNTQKWTNLDFSNQEKINCNILLNITSRKDDIFVAEIQIQSSRPIYNSSYNSPLVNYKDKEVTFSYKEFEPLIYSENQLSSNLVAILAYYSYYMIAIDQDTYYLNGGDAWYQKASQIVDVAQNSNYGGWSSIGESRNRYWIVNEAKNTDLAPYREFLYNYHLQGLDIMANNTDQGRKIIETSFPLLIDSHKKRPSSMLLEMFFSAKHGELISLFSQGDAIQKSLVSKSLKNLDPFRINEYNTILAK